MLQNIKRLSAASLACAALMLMPSLAEARVQKPGVSQRAHHLRPLYQRNYRTTVRPVVQQDWSNRWWSELNSHQRVDYMLYGAYMD